MARSIRGSITVEILVAFAVFTLLASAILMVSQGAREAAAASTLHQDIKSAAELDEEISVTR